MKKWIHPWYNQDVQVQCICGNNFTVSSVDKGPIKVETCPACHPTYNKWKVQTKVIKWRMEKFLEKQKRVEKIKSAA